MIKTIDIPNFGCFKEFVWRDSLRDGAGNILEFKRLNILYGRNYSGKTTLSRILRSLQEQRFPKNYRNPKFTITTSSTILDNTHIASHTHNIRVYNKDFVDENLSFLRNHDGGEIKTFAIIGGENVELEKQIAEKEIELGSIETETGLSSKHAKKATEFAIKKKAAQDADNELTERLRRRANDVIKQNRVYGHAGYNLKSIEADIKAVRTKSFAMLDAEQIKERNELLKEEELPDITERLSFTPQLNLLWGNASQLISKEIKPTEPIQELLNDAVLQAWVKTGMPYHRNKRETCGFCRQPISENLWKELDAHFSKEATDLDEQLIKSIEAVNAEIASLKEVITVKKERFYSIKRTEFDVLHKKIVTDTKNYESELNSIINALRARQSDIFKPGKCIVPTDNTSSITDTITAINNLIADNNKTTKSLADDKKTARNELRLNDVANFINDINLSAEESKICKLLNTAEESEKEVTILQGQVNDLIKVIESLRIKQKDEKKGVEKINEYLNHFFGHDCLKLEAVEDPISSKFKFRIMRGTEPAHNLSEGECSLVAFCYFVARLEDTETKGKNLLIYIDDPISSLDGNHIFFLYSLIESVIAKPHKKPDGSNEFRYRQMFISTHNLDFFKYLKRLSHPANNHGGTSYFMVETNGQRSSLSPMPDYLKKYATEFNYLFHQVYLCRNAAQAREDHGPFYNFGNNLRKFLEAYLFYKYPYHDGSNGTTERLTKFFGDDTTSFALTNRIANELSHLEEIFDRSIRPVEIPEIPALANFVLDKIFEKDPDQYNALLKSIGEQPRVA